MSKFTLARQVRPFSFERLYDLHVASLRLLGLLARHEVEDDFLREAIGALAALLDARYGAIGILDETGERLARFVYTGITPEEAARIGRLPEGRGLLGVVIKENHALRLEDVARDPRAAGFPPHHPPMKSLLAVPIHHNSQVFGRVYLSGKHDGVPFTEEDERVAQHFADALALTIAYHRERAERQREVTALQELAEVTSGVTGEALFKEMATCLARVLQMDFAFVGELDRQKQAVRTVAFCAGGKIVDNITYKLHGTPCENVINEQRFCVYPDHIRQQFPEDRLPVEMDIESYMGAPLFDSTDRAIGLLVLMSHRPIGNYRHAEGILRICAARAAAEFERLRAGELLARTASEWTHAMDFVEDALYLVDLDDKVIRANQAFYKLTGLGPDKVIGHDISFLMHPQGESVPCPVCRARRERRDAHTTMEADDPNNPTGKPIEVMVRMVRDAAGKVSRVVMGIHDLSRSRQMEERLRYLAYYDPLTGLPNRTLLLDRLNQAMLDASRVDRLVAIMFLDLDRFKVINDTLGHQVGDALLKAVAERLQACVRPGDIISRLGGDEFTVVLSNVAHVDDIARVARKILDSFARPFTVERRELFTTTSIGITIYPFDDRDAVGLLKNADAAMYHAKERGRNTAQFFTTELNVRAERRLELETALRTALERNELSLHYQPQVDLKTGCITGMEALARWKHPGLGQVSPTEFIPVAEETGLILPIGEWVLREACRQIRRWHASGFPALQVAVNLSGKQLRQRDFPQRVRSILRETKLKAPCLDLELTESLLMTDIDEITAAMQELHRLGVSFSVDDFGTGYSSLAYLKHFPIDVLKIDRSFVRDLANDPNDLAIAKTIIAMAHTLGMRVIAEGVETYDQLEFLRSQGCDGSQGYYCSEPLDVDTFTELLRDWNRLRAGRCRGEERNSPKKPAKRRRQSMNKRLRTRRVRTG